MLVCIRIHEHVHKESTRLILNVTKRPLLAHRFTTRHFIGECHARFIIFWSPCYTYNYNSILWSMHLSNRSVLEAQFPCNKETVDMYIHIIQVYLVHKAYINIENSYSKETVIMCLLFYTTLWRSPKDLCWLTELPKGWKARLYTWTLLYQQNVCENHLERMCLNCDSWILSECWKSITRLQLGIIFSISS